MSYSKGLRASAIIVETNSGGSLPLNEVTSASSVWNPLDIPGLQVFLDSAHGHNGEPGEQISSWMERSPKQRIFLQPSLTERPYVSTIAEGIGGHPVIKVTNANQWMSCNGEASLGVGDTGITVVALFKSNATGNHVGRGLCGTWGSTNGWVFSPRGPYQTAELDKYGVFSVFRDDASVHMQNVGYIADGKYHLVVNNISKTSGTFLGECDSIGWSNAITGTLAAPNTLDMTLFRYNNPADGIADAGIRFLFVFNRSLTEVETRQLVSWINEQVSGLALRHSKKAPIDLLDRLYVRTDGNDANSGRVDSSDDAIETLSKAFERFDDVPSNPVYWGDSFVGIGAGSFTTRKHIKLGPGLYNLPMIDGLHATTIEGSYTVLETRNVVSIVHDGQDYNDVLKVLVDGPAIADGAWRKKLLNFNSNDYHRVEVINNVGNTLYCTSHEAHHYTETFTHIDVIEITTELRLSYTRYHAMVNSWSLYFYNCKISAPDGLTYGGWIDIQSSYIWFVNCVIENIGLVARHGKALLRRTLWDPNFSDAMSGFWAMTRQGGRIVFDGVMLTGDIEGQNRVEIQTGQVKFIGINAMHGVQGIRLTQSVLVGTGLLYMDTTQYGIWMTDSVGEAPALKRVNTVYPPPESSYGDWDFRCEGGSTVTVPNSGQASYKVSGDNGLTECSIGYNGGRIIHSGTRILDSSRGWQSASLLNSWVDEGTSTYETPAYMKDAAGMIKLKGAVKNGTVGLPIFTLPLGLRPSKKRNFLVSTSVGVAHIEIDTSGTITALDGTGTIFLDSISF